MKCPSCNNKAISFFHWGKGIRWYKTKCIGCNAKLEANYKTWIALIITVFLGLTIGYVSLEVFILNKYTSIILGIITAFISGFISYSSICGYRAIE